VVVCYHWQIATLIYSDFGKTKDFSGSIRRVPNAGNLGNSGEIYRKQRFAA